MTEGGGCGGGKPPWIRVRAGQGGASAATRDRLRRHGLHTVCEAAACPNQGVCWTAGRATVLILGDRCTRACRFCNVDKRPVGAPDSSEPARVAEAVRESGLREVVITSVTRDDLPDGGAACWAETVRRIRAAAPGVLIEVLTPDFRGDAAALDAVIAARPDVFGHNLETVPRLYPAVRPQADYQQSLAVLSRAAAAGLIIKTSLMLGMGETADECAQTLRDARAAGCAIFYAGQYLQPSPRHLPVTRFVTPKEFADLQIEARRVGFAFAACAPLVRSSYHEEEQSATVRRMTQMREGWNP
ncbi:MAG: lipoyl synthase [Lentisphaerae bacterium]|nr:lipoyl synthase [Lentisphaerota bacterium]